MVNIKDPLRYERAFVARRGLTPAQMKIMLNDLSFLFVRLLLLVIIYQILSFMTATIIRWIERCVAQKKRTRRDRHPPPSNKENPNAQPKPEIQRMGPTMI